VSDLDRSMHRSPWVYIAHSSFIEGSQTTKNTASEAVFLVFSYHSGSVTLTIAVGNFLLATPSVLL
jgi:hypothetical protein